MNYIKIKVTSKISTTRLNRTFLVSPHISLKMLGVAIMSSFRSSFEHLFFMQDKECKYLPSVFDLASDRELYLSNCSLNDVVFDTDNSFVLEYDSGEGYDFKIKVLGETDIPLSGNSYESSVIKCIDGKGYGILEDDFDTLVLFINNEIDLSSLPDDLKEILNVFDEPLDIEYINNNMIADIFYFTEEV